MQITEKMLAAGMSAYSEIAGWDPPESFRIEALTAAYRAMREAEPDDFSDIQRTHDLEMRQAQAMEGR